MHVFSWLFLIQLLYQYPSCFLDPAHSFLPYDLHSRQLPHLEYVSPQSSSKWMVLIHWVLILGPICLWTSYCLLFKLSPNRYCNSKLWICLCDFGTMSLSSFLDWPTVFSELAAHRFLHIMGVQEVFVVIRKKNVVSKRKNRETERKKRSTLK